MNSNPIAPRSHRGFTIVEILVVLAVILVLISLVLGVSAAILTGVACGALMKLTPVH